MKEILVMIAGLLICLQSYAEQDEMLVTDNIPTDYDSVTTFNRPYIVKTNLTGPFSLLYEMKVRAKQSLQFSVNRINYELVLGGDSKYFALTSAYKFYLFKKASTAKRPDPSGWYLSPYIRYANVREITTGFIAIDEERSEVAYNRFGGGALAGYQVIFRKGFTLDFFAGVGYLPLSNSRIIYTYPGYQPIVKTSDYKTDLRIGICIGFAFKD